jgi:hypothetical protein
MKKMFFAVLFAALMLIPMSSMAAMTSISDSEMDAITGQSGVTIDIAIDTLAIGIKSITWGDPDGLGGTVNVDQGFVNMSIPTGLIMHIAILDPLRLTIDVGNYIYTAAILDDTDTTDVDEGVPAVVKSSVQLGLSSGRVTLDAFMAGIFFDTQNAVAQDYLNLGGVDGIPAGVVPEYATWPDRTDYNLKDLPAALNDKCVGVFGISGVSVAFSDITLTISAH